MREIFFRGKSVNGIGWVEGSLRITTIQPADDAPFKHYEIEDTTCGVFPNDFMSGICETVDPDTVGQFTGLIDKNGKRIFEGDIVRDSNNFVGIVEFGTGTFDSGVYCYTGWHRRGRDGRVDHTELHDYGWPKEFEVIGNIHDNPELLGGVEDG